MFLGSYSPRAVEYMLRSAVCGGYWRPPGPNFAGDPGVPWDQKVANGLDPLIGSRTIKILAFPKVAGEVLGDEFSPKGVLNHHLGGFKEGPYLSYGPITLSSKLTELTESSPSAPPPSVLCGSGILSQLASPSMEYSGHFDPSQTYDGYKTVEVLDPACTEFLAKGKDCFEHYNPSSLNGHYCYVGKKPCRCTRLQASNVRRYLWDRKDGPFRKELQVSEAPTPDGTSGFSHLTGSRQRDVERWTNVGGPIPVGGRPIYSSSEVPISRINSEGVVKRIRIIADSPPDPDAEGSDELDGEEVEVVSHLVGHQSRSSSFTLLPKDSKFMSFPVLPELSNPLLLLFVLPFLQLHQVLPMQVLP
ncbi:hypothetical protein O181_051970 [Austropuccinia psidii MF-1]|uniref:Uncharacterized protein n=1 Tax=Austropuccinia psidii MF-1 TaxID=1389203 RepID=A0A9Q3E411_9BASI|nr:hypothetical protein [Austropuccinia psidii MF-1]